VLPVEDNDSPMTLPAAARFVLIACALAAAGFAALLAVLWFVQERLLFFPTPLPANATLSLDRDVQERSVEVPGARLSVLELRLPDPSGVVFFLHGNGGNLASWFVNTDFYRRANVDLVMLDYRGYGKSTGRIESEAQLHADVATVWREVAPRYRCKHRVFYGRSLGSGLAAALAANEQPDLTVLVSPYESLVALARQHYPWVPEAVLRYRLRTDQALPAINGPVLLMHGDRDTLIPPAHSEALLARSPTARRVLVPGAAHNDLQDFPVYRQALAEALATLR